jgi:hypothetical protein
LRLRRRWRELSTIAKAAIGILAITTLCVAVYGISVLYDVHRSITCDETWVDHLGGGAATIAVVGVVTGIVVGIVATAKRAVVIGPLVTVSSIGLLVLGVYLWLVDFGQTPYVC